ncbi:GapS4b family protein [Desulfobacterium sp. N47]|uniref:GapS4b family protein n=1 Tax=Desulfobacterium sp. N47 TaxID=3115210 RepID=UPI003F4A0CB5
MSRVFIYAWAGVTILITSCTKEDSPKVNTQTIRWASNATLVESVPDNFDINSVLDLEFSNFAVKGSPNFIPVDGDADHLLLEFEIERNDYSKNWASAQNTFKGSLELKKVRQGNEVKLVVTHTANETKYVASKVSCRIVRHFKDKKHVGAADEIKRIEFGLFTNPGRINYFLALTQNVSSSLLTFDDLVDVEFSPESTSALPEKIKWMEKRIEDLKLNGKGLHNTFFVKDKDLHTFVHLYHVLARYKFDFKGLTGNSVVSIGFPEFGRSKEPASELEVNIKSISFEQAPKNLTRGQMTKIILSEFDELKLLAFDALKPEHLA